MCTVSLNHNSFKHCCGNINFTSDRLIWVPSPPPSIVFVPFPQLKVGRQVQNHVVLKVSVVFDPFPHVLQQKVGRHGLEQCDCLTFYGVCLFFTFFTAKSSSSWSLTLFHIFYNQKQYSTIFLLFHMIYN